MTDSTSVPTPQSQSETRDVSQFIRTYAKDVAAQTGAQAASASKFQPTAATQAASEGVSLPEVDASPVDHGDNPSSPKEFKTETIDLPTMQDASDVLATTRTSVPPAPFQPLPQSTIPQSFSVPRAVASEPEKPPESSAQREEVLARLRTKLAAQSLPQTPVAPPQLSSAVPLPAPAPTPESLPVPTPSTPPPKKPNTSFADSAPIHTYSTDFADQVDAKKASQFSVLAAQADQKPAARISSKRGVSVVFLGASIGVLVLMLGGTAIGYLALHHPQALPVVTAVPSLVVADQQLLLKGTGDALKSALAELSSQAPSTSQVVMTYILASPEERATGMAYGDFFSALALPAPNILVRNIQSDTAGIVRTTDDNGDETRPFFVLQVSSYERSFAGMLAWEPTIRQDLAAFYPNYPVVAVTPTPASEISTTTATSTSLKSKKQTPKPTITPVIAPPPFSYQFIDAVVANHDVRILRNPSGKSILLYGYKDPTTLILARNEAAFTLLLGRLSPGD